MRVTLLVAVALTQANGNAERPHVTLNCDDAAAIRAAAVTLEGTCQSNHAGYEWGGSFATPDNEYKWVAQARQRALNEATPVIDSYNTLDA